MLRIVTIDDITRALQKPLPGEAAQGRMATKPRFTPADFAHERPIRSGAVLVLLYPQDGELYLPLTQRTDRVANHKGQISLPGGAQEPEDASLWDTALREAQEETGIEPGGVRKIGALSPLLIPVSNFEVHPYVGYTAEPPAFRADPAEVAALITLPLRTILTPEARDHEARTIRGRLVDVPFFRYEQHVIWGATAMILSELEALLEGGQSPDSAP